MGTDATPARLSEARRALFVLPVFAIALLAIGPSDLLSVDWWHALGSDDVRGLLLGAVSGLCLGLLLGRDIYRLRTSQNTLLKDMAIASATLATFGVLVTLRETGLWVWSFASADVFVTVFLGTLFIITLVTERLNNIRVYAYSRRFVFIRRSDA